MKYKTKNKSVKNIKGGASTTDMPNNNKLQVGPQRRNHSTEALWNNVSRRKHI